MSAFISVPYDGDRKVHINRAYITHVYDLVNDGGGLVLTAGSTYRLDICILGRSTSISARGDRATLEALVASILNP